MRKVVGLLVFALLAMLVSAGTAAAAGGDQFRARLSGDEEVPARETAAGGDARFELSGDEMSLSFTLRIENIDNLTASHIHVGAAGTNGPVVAFLWGTAAPGGGPVDRVEVVDGTITAANLVGPLAGRPLSDLITAMRAGNTYVNAHTNDGVAPPDTGTGDFPGGEIRGQIE